MDQQTTRNTPFRQAVLALGSNLGDPLIYLQNACAAIKHLPEVRFLKESNIYRTSPVGFSAQRDFLNAAVLIETTRSPETLLGMCLGIESAFGRQRSVPNGPRTLDLDLIAMEHTVCSSADLILPHPRFRERAFVCYPLKDLFPDEHCFGIPFGPLCFPEDQQVWKTGFSLSKNS